MTKTLILTRHTHFDRDKLLPLKDSIVVPGDVPLLSDKPVPLSKQGVREGRSIAAQMLAEGIWLDTVLHSPYARTTHMGRIVAKAYKVAGREISVVNPDKRLSFTSDEILDAVATLGNENTAQVISHGPNIQRAVKQLTGDRYPSDIYGYTVVIESDEPDWQAMVKSAKNRITHRFEPILAAA